ncbi:MAG: hypothetical protein IKJ01_09425 [Lachnospiraceae bacterium]|nr:hypothetical protein [Lachnospiraceae bacterium]
MSGKKTTVNITEANLKKMNRVLEESGMKQTEFINKAIAQVPIIMLGNRKTIAEGFVDIRMLLSTENDEKIIKEVNRLCLSLNLLMEKIEEFTH